HLGLCTAGAGITTAVVQRLRSAGVQRLNVPFHSARRDAHDWLVGQPGALKTALRAIRTCVDAAMPVAAEVVVTRPTMPHLAETVDVLTHVGVRTICLRRLTAVDVGAPTDYVSRFGWEEFADPAPNAVRVGDTVAAQQDTRPSGAMLFAWRGPRRVRCDACADEQPSAGPESTRVVRARLVDAARHRP